MSVIPNGFAEVTVQLRIPGDAGPAFNVFGVFSDPLASAQDVAINVADTLNNVPGYTDLYTSEVVAELITVYRREDANFVQVHEETISLPGRQLVPTGSPQVAYLLQKSTGLAGRANRGRMYIPGTREAIVNSDGNIISTDLATMQTGASAFLADLATNNVPMYILHDPPKEPPGAPAPDPTLVTALNVAPKVATQRRRLR